MVPRLGHPAVQSLCVLHTGVMAAPPKPLSVDIHTSVKDGDMAKVLEFLEEGGDVNVRCR